MTQITAMLSFWDEPAQRLYRCVQSVAQLADHIVAADGPYALYPHEDVVSSDQALCAVREGAEDGGATIEIAEGCEWAGQVEKRDHLMKMAQDCSDWVFWVDADEVLAQCDAPAVHEELKHTHLEAFQVMRYTPPNPEKRWEPDSNLDEREGKIQRYSRIFKALDDLEVTLAHWVYLGTRQNGVRVTLWGPRFNPPFPYCREGDLRSDLLFEHYQTWRTDENRERQLTYRERTKKQVQAVGAEQ